MRILVDLGTARTGVAVQGDHDDWQPLAALITSRSQSQRASRWGPLSDLISGVLGLRHVADPMPHVVTHSRFCQVGPVVLPFSLAGTDVSLPCGADKYPDPRRGAFRSVKESPEWATPFLAALARLVNANVGVGSQWIIGHSCGGLDPRRLGLPGGTKSFNEAVAVVFALVSRNVGDLHRDHDGRFVLLGDLGGGFLDVSVADGLAFSEDRGTASIINFGGYPLGVDRIAKRFSTDAITNPDSLIDAVGLVLEYHLWDYSTRTPNGARGVVVLAGGGIERLNRNSVERLLPRRLERFAKSLNMTVDVQIAAEDTKYLTLAGLGQMARRGMAENAQGVNLCDRDPHHHGNAVLPRAKIQAGDALTWYALMDNVRRAAYDS